MSLRRRRLTYEEDGQTTTRYVLVMTPAEIKERLELNVVNTASAKRASVLAHLAKSNGH